MRKSLAVVALTVLLLSAGQGAKGQQSPTEQFLDAAYHGQTDVVARLLKKHLDIEAKDNFGQTALIRAASGGQAGTVLLLLQHGARIEAVGWTGQTALIEAAESNETEVVQVLLEHGANLEATDHLGQTALSLAAENGYMDVVKALLAKGANIEDGQPLLAAAGSGNQKMVEFLLDSGANLHATNKIGATALLAVACGTHNNDSDPDLVQLFVDKGLNVDTASSYGITPLICAAGNGRADIVRILLDHRANITAQDYLGESALIAATIKQKSDVLELLLDRGAPLEQKSSDGSTALIQAVKYDKPNNVRVLLEHGANIAAVDEWGQTLLLAAACHDVSSSQDMAGLLAIVKLLLDHGAAIEVTDNMKNTPQSCALKPGRQALAGLLDSALRQRKLLVESASLDPQKKFDLYLSILAQNPQDESLRNQIIQQAAALPSLPPVPEAARLLFVTATGEIKQATAPSALDQPIALLRKAADLAPWWGNVYYNLSRALELQGRYDDAIQQLNDYLALKPPAADANEARARLVLLETERDAAAHR